MAKFHVVDEAVIAARPEEIAAMPALKMRTETDVGLTSPALSQTTGCTARDATIAPWPTSSHK
nr:hypothetical protein [uncultured bacterium]